MLSIPSESPAILETGLWSLGKWARIAAFCSLLRYTTGESHRNGCHNLCHCSAINMGKIAPCRSVLVRFNLPRTTLTAMLAGYLLYAIVRHSIGSRPRWEQASHPVHTHGLANTRWLSASRHVFDNANLRRFSLVPISTGRCLQVRWRSVSALGVCLLIFRTGQSARSSPTRQVGSG